ncbi:MAG: hypothetical protein IJH77_00270 [Mogibacterium sp.]|nr:hypothetical protein [Mogibacterium sp.]
MLQIGDPSRLEPGFRKIHGEITKIEDFARELQQRQLEVTYSKGIADEMMMQLLECLNRAKQISFEMAESWRYMVDAVETAVVYAPPEMMGRAAASLRDAELSRREYPDNYRSDLDDSGLIPDDAREMVDIYGPPEMMETVYDCPRPSQEQKDDMI